MDLGHETLDLGRVSMDAAAPTAVQVAVQGGGDGEQEGSALGERVHWSRSCSWKKGDHAGRGRERQGRVEDEQVGDDERKKCPCGAIIR